VNTGSAIIVSAFMVAAIYAWRYLTGGETPRASLTPASVIGAGPLVSPEGFLVAWGVIYLVLAVLSGFSEALAASLAISILLGDILANGVAVARSTSALTASKTTQPTKAKVSK
jgi:hypothetical protein